MRLATDIPASIVNLRISVAEAFGGNRKKIIEKSSITAEQLENPSNRIPVKDVLELWPILIEESGREDLGLETGLRAKMTSMGMLGYVMMNSSTIRSAMEKLSVHQRLVTSVVEMNIQDEDEITHVKCDMVVDWHPALKYTMDFIVGSVQGMIDSGTARDIFPIEAGFMIDEPKNKKDYQRVFNTQNVRFGCPVFYLNYRKSDLESPIIGSNNDLFDHFSELLEEKVKEHEGIEEHSRKVKQLIRKGLKAEIPKVDDVANEMAMSVRSLQNHLKSEGNTYQDLLEEVRKDVSVRQLKNKAFNISDVAFLAGFSDLAVFSRSFKKWTGMTPTEFKTQHI